MSRFFTWYMAEQLGRMGWPRSKGLLRKKTYVDAKLLDIVVVETVRVSVGLGAGDPQDAVAILADTFPNNQWSEESVDDLLRILAEGEVEIANNPELPPWEVLYSNPKMRVASYGDNLPWKDLSDPAFHAVWASAFTKGIFWGLTHEKDMPLVFDNDKEKYEETAREANAHGLGVSADYPFQTLDDFYGNCETLVRAYESIYPLSHEIPDALAAAPLIAKRLKVKA